MPQSHRHELVAERLERVALVGQMGTTEQSGVPTLAAIVIELRE